MKESMFNLDTQDYWVIEIRPNRNGLTSRNGLNQIGQLFAYDSSTGNCRIIRQNFIDNIYNIYDLINSLKRNNILILDFGKYKYMFRVGQKIPLHTWSVMSYE